ncbi:hypothetical protein RIF29_39245 [Crotalaria pallida]|uniref:B box-type domain-containing protein n=1 Tax=Crotalaria pallida TaxID=3830 RepID=A0AAN9HPG2_CROPI
MEEMWLCSLCGKRARMVCESDQAKLCWDCDHKVHSANFLVERHLRILLCRLCQSPTPWKACGPSLTPTFSLCHPCFLLQNNNNNREDDDDSDDNDQDESNAESDESDESSDLLIEEDEEEDGENQVVPWFSPSPSSSSIGSDAGTDRWNTAVSSASAGATSCLPLKRFPLNSSVHDFDDEIGCSSSTEELCRPLKKPRIGINQREAEAEQWHNH